jgi:hypothetical protein
MLDFWDWFFAVALGAGEFAFAATVGPILTFGAVPVVVCDCAKPSVSNPAPTSSPANKNGFFMSFLLRLFFERSCGQKRWGRGKLGGEGASIPDPRIPGLRHDAQDTLAVGIVKTNKDGAVEQHTQSKLSTEVLFGGDILPSWTTVP